MKLSGSLTIHPADKLLTGMKRTPLDQSAHFSSGRDNITDRLHSRVVSGMSHNAIEML